MSSSCKCNNIENSNKSIKYKYRQNLAQQKSIVGNIGKPHRKNHQDQDCKDDLRRVRVDGGLGECESPCVIEQG